ncbi:MAG: hypothetical protein ACLUVZ_10085 [Bacteroides stercoris]
MVKLSVIIPIREGRTNSAQKELREYNLKGWNLTGCTSCSLIVEKDVECDSIVCLEEYNNAAKKENMPLIYVVEKNGLYGIIDEYGTELIPCTYQNCDYKGTLNSPEHCTTITFYTENGDVLFDRCTSKIHSYNMQDVKKQLENLRLKYENN